MQVRVRATWELGGMAANALALPVTRELIFTERLLAVCSDEEVAAICAHELAHLTESKAVLAGRLLRSFSFSADLRQSGNSILGVPRGDGALCGDVADPDRHPPAAAVDGKAGGRGGGAGADERRGLCARSGKIVPGEPDPRGQWSKQTRGTSASLRPDGGGGRDAGLSAAGQAPEDDRRGMADHRGNGRGFGDNLWAG